MRVTRFQIAIFGGLVSLAVLVSCGTLAYLRHKHSRATYGKAFMTAFSETGGKAAAELKVSLAALNEEQPELDAQAAAASGDYRFVACMGYGAYFPGHPNGSHPGFVESTTEPAVFPPVSPVRDYWSIRGTSDFVESLEHAELISRAESYAEKYNRQMWKLREVAGKNGDFQDE